jgi:hypothetical protein
MTTDSKALFYALGEFWQRQLSDADLLALGTFAELMVEEDVNLRNMDLTAAIAIHTIQPYLTRQWGLLELLESGLNVEPNIIVFGAEGRRFDGSFVYGQTEAASFAWPAPSQLRSIGIITDKIVTPTYIWDITNFVFEVSAGVLRFRENPFEVVTSELLYNSDGTPKTYTDATGATRQDRRLKLWMRDIEIDERTPYLRFGSVVGIGGESSQAYIDTVEATWSMLLQGPSVEALERGLLASAGLKYVESPEVVEVVELDIDGLVVVTDKTVYRGHAKATPLVSVGDHLKPGDFVFDTVVVTDFSDGNPDNISNIKGLVLSAELAEITGNVVIPNRLGSWSVLGIRDGEPEVRFEVLGSDRDVSEFWDRVHARGVATGKPLADYIPYNTLMSPINPLEFMLANILGSSLIFIEVKPQDFLTRETGFLGRIKSLLPAGVLVIAQIALDPVEDSLSMAEIGSPEQVSAPAGGTNESVAITPGVLATDSNSITLTAYEPKVWNA